MNLEGKVALVTGALGKTGSEVLRKETGRKIYTAETEMSDRAQPINAVEQTVANFGRIDILAVWSITSLVKWFMDSPEQAWDEVVNANFKGYALTPVTRRCST